MKSGREEIQLPKLLDEEAFLKIAQNFAKFTD